MKISVCIPMYNEEKIIRDTAKTLHAYMCERFGEDFEIVFSDDGSLDKSADAVRELGLSNVRVVGYEKNRGKGSAIRSAMLASKGEYVMFTDADLAYGTEVIRRAYDTLNNEPDAAVLIGSRNLTKDGYEGYTALRKMASKLYIRLIGFLGGFKLTDSQCGCKVYKNIAAKDIFSRCQIDGFAFDFESIIWASKLGYSICEMPVKVINHRSSTVHIFKDSLKMTRDVLKIKKSVNAQCKKLSKINKEV